VRSASKAAGIALHIDYPIRLSALQIVTRSSCTLQWSAPKADVSYRDIRLLSEVGILEPSAIPIQEDLYDFVAHNVRDDAHEHYLEAHSSTVVPAEDIDRLFSMHADER
jgi:hypothetical protein